MDKINHKGPGSAVFYKPVAGVQEVKTGYLIKSPPSGPFKSLRSWKRRFFVLFKMSEDKYQLKYFKSSEDRERPLGGIDMTQISLLFASPQKHARWPWINRNFRCAPECVLYIRVSERDYFLIGENSSELDDWFSEFYEALKNRPQKSLSPEEMSDEPFSTESISDPVLRICPLKRSNWGEAGKGNEKETTSHSEIRREKSVSFPFSRKPQSKQRSISAPTPVRPPSFVETGKAEEDPSRRWSEPLNPDYDYPATYLRQLGQRCDDEEETYEDDGTSYYVPMETVYKAVREAEQRHKDLVHPDEEYGAYDACSQNSVGQAAGNDITTGDRNGEAELGSRGSLLRSVTQVFDKLKIQMPSLEEEKRLVEGEDLPCTSSSASTENGLSPSPSPNPEKGLAYPSPSPTPIPSPENGLAYPNPTPIPSPENGLAYPYPNPNLSPENGLASPVSWDMPQPLDKRSSTQSSNEEVNPEEKDIHVNQSDLKKHLTLEDMEGSPRVFGWTAEPQTTCVFHKGDQVLAINDLYTSSVEEFQTYLSRLMKNQVKLTILRLPGSEPLHSALHSCE